jgi:hypothetical protein
MLETGTSGLMSGDEKRDDALSSAPLLVLDSTMQFDSEATVLDGDAPNRRPSCSSAGVQAETSQHNLLMMDTLDHLGSTIRPNCIFAFPQVAVSYEKFHGSYVIYDQYRDHSKRRVPPNRCCA